MSRCERFKMAAQCGKQKIDPISKIFPLQQPPRGFWIGAFQSFQPSLPHFETFRLIFRRTPNRMGAFQSLQPSLSHFGTFRKMFRRTPNKKPKHGSVASELDSDKKPPPKYKEGGTTLGKTEYGIPVGKEQAVSLFPRYLRSISDAYFTCRKITPFPSKVTPLLLLLHPLKMTKTVSPTILSRITVPAMVN